ncbi:MAG: Uma2 family endonuclease [Methylobacteriaceae bacterium]|nr:Uma2 family endonuclease [Methylobacteriaceae bacterium]
MNRASQQFERMSLDDFEELLADRPANERWELIGGRVVKMMVGARWEHHRIVQNMTVFLANRFRATGSSCRVFDETFYVKDQTLDAAALPDVMVRCDPLEPGATSLDDPIVVIEVMSQGTEARDRLQKWQIYQQLSSLRHYVLVTRDRAHVEAMDRDAGSWSGFRVLDGLDAVLDLPAIGTSIPLSEIYRDVLAPPA